MSKMGRSKILGSVGWDAFNPFPSKLGKTSHFAILLCLTPDYSILLVKGEPLGFIFV